MSRSLVTAVALVVALTTTSAFAAPSPEALAQGTALHNRATELLAQQKYREAAQAFLDAYAKNASPNELFNAARAEMTAGRNKEALKLFNTYLDLPATDRVATEFRKEAAEKAAVCQASLCAIDVRGATETWVDGQKAPGIFYAEPGAHEVMMQGDAPAPKIVKVTCVAKQTLLVEYDEKKPKGPITGDPPPAVTEKGSWLVPAVLAGVGVVGLGLGMTTALIAGGKEGDVETLTTRGACIDRASASCAPIKDAASSASSLSTVSVVGYVAGGAFLAGAVISAIVLEPWKERPLKKTGVRIVPSIGGLWAMGSF